MSATEAKGKGEAEAKPAAKDAGGEAKGGGIGAWLPLIVSIVLMPVLAVVTTKFMVLPKIVQARGVEGAEEGAEKEEPKAAHGESASEGKGKKEESGHGEKKDPKGGEKKEAKAGGHGAKGKKKENYQISKVIVNVAGSMGSRYLMASFTLVGTQADFKDTLDENKDQLLDLANTTLASKTISELEKPGARNQIRAELISIFNNALGGNYIQEIFFTEFAIQ